MGKWERGWGGGLWFFDRHTIGRGQTEGDQSERGGYQVRKGKGNKRLRGVGLWLIDRHPSGGGQTEGNRLRKTTEKKGERRD